MAEQPPVEVIVIIASAGGMHAILRVLRDLPPDLPVAVVVAQHLGGNGSQLVPLLDRRVELTVSWAVEGGRLAPGTVTVAPPRVRLELLPDRTCGLKPFSRVVSDRPLDALLTSSAETYGAGAVAVVLTGMGNDGVEGAKALRSVGGVVLVQDEATADHPALPMSVAATGAADRVLPLPDIGPALVHLVSGATHPPQAEAAAARALFAGDGEAARLGRDLDWAATPLGPVNTWSGTLRTSVRTALAAPLAMCLLWGPDQVQIYNDAYRVVMQDRHPGGLGRTNRDCWPEVWHLNEPIYTSVLGGTAVSLKEARYPITRHDVLVDAWFDLVFVPVRDEENVVAGVLCTVVEKTGEVLAARRLRTLHELTDRTAGATTGPSVVHGVLAVLAESADVAFAVAYRVGRPGVQASLVGAVGVESGGPLAPVRLGEATASASGPLGEAVRTGEPAAVDDVAVAVGGPAGAVRRPALAVPLRDPWTNTTTGLVLLGICSGLPDDAPYAEFLRLVGREVADRILAAQVREREQERLRRLAELDRVKNEFFAGVTHEFRAPLTLLLGALEELTTSDELPDRLRTAMGQADRSGRRLLRLVESLREFSRAETGRSHPQFAPTDLAALTGEIAAMFRGVAQQAGLTLTIDAPALPEPVWVDRQMWESVLVNLLTNALKFTFDGGVHVGVRALPQHAEIEVRDTGVGIPRSRQPHLFTRFYRVRDTRARTHDGMGTGLALTHDLVRRHHGRIRVHSAEGEGTAVTVWLPLEHRFTTLEAPEPTPVGALAADAVAEVARWVHPAHDAYTAVAPDAPDTPGGRACGPVVRAPGARVLVVDDDPDMRDYLSRVLSPCWPVAQARDGTEALRVARRDPPDLILVDVPVPDGPALVRAIRADPVLAVVSVLLVTARVGEETVVDGLLAGADDCVGTPFSARELVARVGAQLELARLRTHGERRFRALVAACHDAVYRMSPDWTELRALAGRGLAGAVVPDPAWRDTFVPPADQPAVMAAIARAVRDKAVFALEHRVLRVDGTVGRVRSRAVPVLGADGEIIEWVGVASEITAWNGVDAGSWTP